MPKTVKAKLLLGHMPKAEALKTLSFCEFNQPLSENDATALWEAYRDKTNNLPPREAASPLPQQLTAKEQKIVTNFMKDMKQRTTGRYLSKVIKVDPRDVAIHQFLVITERSQEYAKKMSTEENRALQCLGVGTEFRGQFPVRTVGMTTIVQLPHAEYIVQGMPNGFNFVERDRYISAVEAGKTEPLPNFRGLWEIFGDWHALIWEVLRRLDLLSHQGLWRSLATTLFAASSAALAMKLLMLLRSSLAARSIAFLSASLK